MHVKEPILLRYSSTPRCCAVGCSSLPVACVMVLVGIVGGRLLVGGVVAASVEVKSPVGSTVFMPLVVLCPVEVQNIGQHFVKVAH